MYHTYACGWVCVGRIPELLEIYETAPNAPKRHTCHSRAMGRDIPLQKYANFPLMLLFNGILPNDAPGTIRIQVRVEARFRSVRRKSLQGLVVDWRAWVSTHRQHMAAVLIITQAWFEYRRRCDEDSVVAVEVVPCWWWYSCWCCCRCAVVVQACQEGNNNSTEIVLAVDGYSPSPEKKILMKAHAHAYYGQSLLCQSDSFGWIFGHDFGVRPQKAYLHSS